jgi:hypothetical protein
LAEQPSCKRQVSGSNPLTGSLRATAKTEQQAQIELGRLLKDASDGRQPESGATVAKLMDEYVLPGAEDADEGVIEGADVVVR